MVTGRGVGVLDAPVSGADVGAKEGTLSIMVGGEEADFSRAKPLFEAMGKTVVRVGEAGAGQTVKACNQVVVALITEAVSEALVLGSKAGVAPGKIIEVLSGGLAGNKVMEVKGEASLARLRTGREGNIPSQGSGDSTGSSEGVRGVLAGDGNGKRDVRGDDGEGSGRLGSLRPAYAH